MAERHAHGIERAFAAQAGACEDPRLNRFFTTAELAGGSVTGFRPREHDGEVWFTHRPGSFVSRR